MSLKFTLRGSVKSTSLVSFRPRGTKGMLKVSLWEKKKTQKDSEIFVFCLLIITFGLFDDRKLVC